MHAHEPGQHLDQHIGEGVGPGAFRLPLVENGVEGEAAVFVLNVPGKLGPLQFGGQALKLTIEEAPILAGVVGCALFAVLGQHNGGKAFARLHKRFGGEEGTGGRGQGVIEEHVPAEFHGQHGEPGQHEEDQNEHGPAPPVPKPFSAFWHGSSAERPG